MSQKEADQYAVDFQALDAGSGIYNALKNVRFVVLKNHGVQIDNIEQIKNAWQSFFASKAKYSFLRTDESDEGFIPINYETASKELMADFKELYQTHYGGVYPSNIDITTTMELFTAMVELNEEICGLIDQQLSKVVREKMPVSLLDMVKGANNHLLRVIHYPPIDDREMRASRGAAHTDISLFTAVFGLMIEGLEFQDESGNWYSPKVDSEDIIFFNSEMVELCTRGLLKALPHQVKTDPTRKTESRYAIPINFHPYRDIELTCGLTAIQYLKKRLNQMGYDGELLMESDY